MTNRSHPIPEGATVPSSPSTASIHSSISRSSSKTALSNIGKAAKKAVEPSLRSNNRSLSNGIAAVLVEGHLVPSGQNNNGNPPSPPRHRKRDIIPNFFRSLGSDSKVKKSQSSSSMTTVHSISTTSVNTNGTGTSGTSLQYSSDHDSSNSLPESIEIERAVTSTDINSPALESLPISIKSELAMFLRNVNKPNHHISLPAFHARIDTTPQLVLCTKLLSEIKNIDNSQSYSSQVVSSDTTAQSEWIKAAKQDLIEQDHIQWLGSRMVDEFAKDGSKDSSEIAEVVFLGPVLKTEAYRRLLQSVITAFEQATLLDVDLLQGLVQLIQSAPHESLYPDDLVKILSIIRLRLQDTHQQSTAHPLHLTLAISRLLDVMAEHKVRDLDRVVEHEPLSKVLTGMKESSDPYMMYQACYAFQALQYVPDNESALQAVLRHSVGVVEGLTKISAVLKLDVGTVLKGLENLQETLGEVFDTGKSVYEGVGSLIESGQGVLDSLTEGYGSGKKRPWYAAISAANAFIQTGQLKDFNDLIRAAPCRRDPLFQWGICQLLGEIASDNIWDSSVRQQAVELLGKLLCDDPEWGCDASVKTWMLNIIGQLCTIDDQVVAMNALALLKATNHDQNNTAKIPYPLRSRLPLPTVSPVLARVQNIPYVEYDIHQLQVQRLKESSQSEYVPLLAKPDLKSKDDAVFSLMDKVQEFLTSERQVMLVLGDSGAGKSTFNRHLEHRLWTEYKQGGPIPLFINLPSIDAPDKDMVAKQLQAYNFKDEQIRELKLHRQFILICDGYDESQQLVNLHQSNMLNKPGQWNTKMIISCRTQFLGPNYLDRFQPQPENRYASEPQKLFQEAVIAPFSKDQIKSYVEQYAKNPETWLLYKDQLAWSAEDYLVKLIAIPNVMDLVKNPFLLTLALKALPGLVASNKDFTRISLTRVELYDMFVDQWLELNKLRLRTSTLSNEELTAFSTLSEDGFVECGVDYLTRLSIAIFDNQEGHPVVQYTHRQDKDSWKAAFFGPEPEVKLLRDSSPLVRTGSQYRFVHRSVWEYCCSRIIYGSDRINSEGSSPQSVDTNSPLFRWNLLAEPSIIQFLCDRVKEDLTFEKQLRSVIDLSKTESNVSVAAANAMTILVKAGVSFHGADLRRIKVPGADLSRGQFDSARFYGADLTGVNFGRSWLRKADLSHTKLENVKFGEEPYIVTSNVVQACAYSPNGKLLALGFDTSRIEIYETDTWTRTHRLGKHYFKTTCISFSPDSQRIVFGDMEGAVQVWDCISGELVLGMWGLKGKINSVAYSPCGKQIATAGNDTMVRLWNSQTGEALFTLKGHTTGVVSIGYSPDGKQLVSGSHNGEITFWNPDSGKAEENKTLSSKRLDDLIYSTTAGWLGVTLDEDENTLQLWNAVTGEPGVIFQGHTGIITGVATSPSGGWIATSSMDRTTRVWDESTGALASIFNQIDGVHNVTFSPDGSQLATGGHDKKMRLWELHSNWSNVESQNLLHPARKLSYSLDGSAIISLGDQGTVRQFNAQTGKFKSVVFNFPKYPSIVSMDLSIDGDQLATGCGDGSVRLWDFKTGFAGPMLDEPWSTPTDVVFSPCGRWAVAASRNETVRLWDLYEKRKSYLLVEIGSGRGDLPGLITFSPKGDRLAIGFQDGTVEVFCPHTKSLMASKYWPHQKVTTLGYSPDGQQLAVGTKERSLYIEDLPTGRTRVELRGHTGPIRCVAYSKCGRWIISGSDDETVRVWRVEGWKCVAVVQGLFSRVLDVAWNPSIPMEFATACEDGSIRVWQLLRNFDHVTVRMAWGPDLGLLSIADMKVTDASGLDPIYCKLLSQRGAIDVPESPKDDHDCDHH